MKDVICASGGIGNRLCAVASAEATGNMLCWQGYNTKIEDLFPKGLNCEITYKNMPNMKVVWTFPNVDHQKLLDDEEYRNSLGHDKPDNYGNFQASFVYNAFQCKGDGKITKPCFDNYGHDICENTIGIHIRGLHPCISVDKIDIVNKINKLSESNAIFLASDIELSGLSCSIMRNKSPKPKNDDDRSKIQCNEALNDLANLSRCKYLIRNSAYSTFVTPLIFHFNKRCYNINDVPGLS